MKNEILIYRPNELVEHIEVRIEDETVWLNRNQLAVLFGRDVKTIGKHINNIFSEGELIKDVVVANFATTTQHGAIKGKTQINIIEFYNLDVIISVGYRVKSKEGTQFRIWANRILKEYLLKGYAINHRMNRIENTVEDLAKKVSEIDLQINANLIPTQGVFFDGQVFDAYGLTSRIIRSAKKKIVLIDNYMDETTLTHLSKKLKTVRVILYTKTFNKQLELDIQKANEQYGNFEARILKQSHDRFLILDDEEIYHLGASLKDLGKKWFAFTKLNGNLVQRILDAVLEVDK
jgi:hypothetical protein